MGQFIFTPSQIEGLKKAIRQKKIAKTTQAIDIVGEVGALAISTIFSINNAKEQERMIDDLARIDESNLRELNEYLSKQKTNTDRVRAYFDFFSRYKADIEGRRISGTIGAKASEKSDSEKRLMKIIFGGAIALILVAVIIKKLRK
jgi:hypothetical protein